MHRYLCLLVSATVLLSLQCRTPAASEDSIFAGDGSEESGFVPPPKQPKLPPPPPRSVSAAETFIPGPPPPVTPQSRSEPKKPPRPPVLFTKLKSGYFKDWSATPNDVNNLLKKMKDMVDVNYVMEIKELSEVDPDPEKNPVLYRSGHYHFSYTPQERKKLREFMLNGGMLLLNTGLGSKPFYDSAKEELKLIFPEVHLQRLSSDHPLFHSYYDLDRVHYQPAVRKAGYRGNEPWFDGITINCRTVAVVSRWGMAVGWEEQNDPEYQAYASDDALKLGVNIFAYATAQRAWTKQTANMMTFVDKEEHSEDKVYMAQVIYDGEWKTRHAGLSVLLYTFNQRTDIPVKFGLQELRLSDPKILDTPLLYITGHENFLLHESEMAQLRQYLLNGGFLFAEACCGRKGFDLSFRQHMRALFPEHPLTPIPQGSLLYNLPNELRKLGVTPALAAQIGSSAMEPRLWGVEIDGHYAVVYSPYALAGGWEMSQNPYAHGYENTASMLLGQNILMCAVTQ